MKRTRKTCLALISLLIAICMVGCNAPAPTDPVTVELSAHAFAMTIGQTHTLTATVTGAETPLWYTDAPSVATVNEQGVVTAQGVGTAAITVTVGDATDLCQVTVTDGSQSALGTVPTREGYLYYDDFDGLTAVPDYFVVDESGDGAVSATGTALKLALGGNGSAFASVLFDAPLSGKVIAEARVRVTSKSFSNILFFFRGHTSYDTNECIACLGMNSGSFTNHDGSGWGGGIGSYATDVWYDIRMELNVGLGAYDLFINGDPRGSFPFRHAGDGVEDKIQLLKFGTDKSGATLYYDYIRISQGEIAGAPVLTQRTETYALTASDEAQTVTLDYAAKGTPRPTVTVTAPDGIAVGADNKTLTVAAGLAAGTYTVTVKAQNEFGSVTKNITVQLRADENELLNAQFTNGLDGFTTQGNVTVANGMLRYVTSSTVSTSYARYDFGTPLSGKVYAEMRVVNHNNKFTNLLFFYRAGTTSVDANKCTSSLAMENGKLKYHDGSTWRSLADVSLETAYVIGVTYDYGSSTMSVTLNGTPVLTNGAMRRQSTDTQILIIGSTQVGTDTEIDYVTLRKVTEDAN